MNALVNIPPVVQWLIVVGMIAIGFKCLAFGLSKPKPKPVRTQYKHDA